MLRQAGKTFDLFLSHDWGIDEQARDNHERVQRLNALLQASGVTTWFDAEQMEGNIVDRMCDGIDRSTLVVICVTKNYIRKVAGQGPRMLATLVQAHTPYHIPAIIPNTVHPDASYSTRWMRR